MLKVNNNCIGIGSNLLYIFRQFLNLCLNLTGTMGITKFEFMCIQQKIEPSVVILSVVPTINFIFFLFVICQRRKDLQS